MGRLNGNFNILPPPPPPSRESVKFIYYLCGVGKIKPEVSGFLFSSVQAFSFPELRFSQSRFLVRWFREKIVTDWKKAPNLAHKLSTICKTNLVWVPRDPIIRGGRDRQFILRQSLLAWKRGLNISMLYIMLIIS